MARQKTVGLTSRQQETLVWIKNFIAKNQMPPTVREIGAGLKIESSTAFKLLEALSEKGYLRRGRLGARSLTLIEPKTRDTSNAKRVNEQRALYGAEGEITVPLLGRIAAGQPILAVENQVGEVVVEKRMVGSRSCFALEIHGDSMIEAGINDGDIVIVRQQPVAQNGENVVALIGDEATVKQLSIGEDFIELRPRNSSHRPITISHTDDFRILGKVIAVVPRREPHFMEERIRWRRTPSDVSPTRMS